MSRPVICVNNRHELEWEPGLTVATVLDKMRYTFPHIIVSINGELVPAEEYESWPVPDQADVRVVHLIAGG